MALADRAYLATFFSQTRARLKIRHSSVRKCHFGLRNYFGHEREKRKRRSNGKLYERSPDKTTKKAVRRLYGSAWRGARLTDNFSPAVMDNFRGNEIAD